MHVLEHEHVRTAAGAELGEYTREEFVPGRAAFEQSPRAGAESRGDVQERTQGPRCRERVAGAYEHLRDIADIAREPIYERALAGTCLARDEDHPAVTLRRERAVLRERDELRFTLQQVGGRPGLLPADDAHKPQRYAG